MARLCLVLGILCAVGCQVSETNDENTPTVTTQPAITSKATLTTAVHAVSVGSAVHDASKDTTSASPIGPTATTVSVTQSSSKEATIASPTATTTAASTSETPKAAVNPSATKPSVVTADVTSTVTSTAQASSSTISKDNLSVSTAIPTITKSGNISPVKVNATAVLSPNETSSPAAQPVPSTLPNKISQPTLTTGPTKHTQQTAGGLSTTPSPPRRTTSSGATSAFSKIVPNLVPEATPSIAKDHTTTITAQQPMGKTVPTVVCRNYTEVPKDVVKINVDVSSDCTANSSFTDEEHKAFKQLCDALKAAYKRSDSKCKIHVASTEGKLAIVDTVLEIHVDSSELFKEVKASMKEDKSPLFSFGDAQHSINDDVVSIPLISAIVSLAVALLLIAAIYGCYQQRQTRKREQRLTEELQTMENGYHDNPTLEVMETAPEMQEKKGGPNGELGDSWIVPLDNLTREDLEEEEDTHL